MLFDYFSSNIILRIEMLTTRFSLWKKISSRKHKFPREYYFAISKIKLPQKFRATWYLSIKFITLRVLISLFNSISPSQVKQQG